MKLNLSLVAVLFIIWSNNTFSQADYTWDKVPEKVAIPEKYNDADAVIIAMSQSVKTFSNEKVFTVGSIYKRIKILTKKGIEDHSRIFFRYENNRMVKVLDARTIKENGEIINLSAADIKKQKYITKEGAYKYVICAIPGVEVGDVIEIQYSYKYDGVAESSNIFLHESLPVLNSSFKLSLAAGIVAKVNMYNGLNQPTVKNSNNFVSYTWKGTNLDGYGNVKYSILENEIPHLTYVITDIFYYGQNNVLVPNDWPLVLKRYGKYITKQDMSVASGNKYEKEFFQKISKKGNSRLEKVQALQAYIFDSIVSLPYDENESRTIGKQLSMGVLEELSTYRMYADYFKYLNIPFKLCVGRNRYTGQLEANFPTLYQLNYIFFSFQDEENKKHFLIPKDDYVNYRVDEIPYQMENSQLIEFHWFRTKELKFIKIPMSQIKENKLFVSGKWNVSLTDMNITLENKEMLAGEYSTLFNYVVYPSENKEKQIKYLEEYLQNKRVYVNKIEDIAFTNAPIKAKTNLSYKVENSNGIVQLDEDLYSIDFSKILLFFNKHTDLTDEERSLVFHNPFVSTENYNFNLTFDKKIRLSEGQDLDINFSNTFGNVTFTIKQMGDNVLNISGRYYDKNMIVTKDRYSEVKDLNNKIYDINQTILTVEVLD